MKNKIFVLTIGVLCVVIFWLIGLNLSMTSTVEFVREQEDLSSRKFRDATNLEGIVKHLFLHVPDEKVNELRPFLNCDGWVGVIVHSDGGWNGCTDWGKLSSYIYDEYGFSADGRIPEWMSMPEHGREEDGSWVCLFACDPPWQEIIPPRPYP